LFRIVFHGNALLSAGMIPYDELCSAFYNICKDLSTNC
jgi:hypothetical protein